MVCLDVKGEGVLVKQVDDAEKESNRLQLHNHLIPKLE